MYLVIRFTVFTKSETDKGKDAVPVYSIRQMKPFESLSLIVLDDPCTVPRENSVPS